MAINFGGSFAGGYGEIGPGYKNPLGENAPSVGGNYDWGSYSKGTDWGGKFGIDKSGLYEQLFGKAKQTEKYRSQAEDFGAQQKKQQFGWGGDMTRGFGGQLLENLSVYEPAKMSPIFLQGQQGSPGFLGSGGGKAIAGIAGVALAPFTGGASLAFAPFVGQGLESAGQTWNV